jgi:hypothetical protein
MKARILTACLVGIWLLTSCHTLTPPAPVNPKLQENANGCLRNLSQLGIAGFIYAGDHAGRLPANWQEYKDCLEADTRFGGPQLLVCPSQRAAPTNWNNFNTNMVSYQMVTPGWVHSNKESGLVVYIYCPEHHFYVMGDGSIHTNESKRFIWPKGVITPNDALEPTATAP